jgi:hypothetical protein
MTLLLTLILFVLVLCCRTAQRLLGFVVLVALVFDGSDSAFGDVRSMSGLRPESGQSSAAL